MLYLHGGAFVRDVMSWHWSLVERLVERTGATVTVPLYPLAPEHAWRDAHAALAPVLERLVAGAGPRGLTLAGDSAGGGLALQLAQRARDEGRPLPARIVLVSPWLDLALADPAQPALARRDPVLDVPGLRAAGRWYADGLDPADARVSPLRGRLSGLPPIAVFTGTHDVLYPDAHRLRERAARDGAPLRYHEYPGLFHVWPAVDLPESRRALDEVAAFMSEAA